MMKKYGNLGTFALALLLIAIVVIGVLRLLGPKIGNTFSTISSCLEPPCPPAPVPTSIMVPTFELPLTGPYEPLLAIDEALKSSISASIAYNAPSEMEVGETVTIELLLNPSLSEPELAREVTEPGAIIRSVIEITPQMKAEIILPTRDALLVTPLHDDAVQFVSGVETTRWSWYVTAQQAGIQRLTIVVYRLVKVDGEESWREVETYKSDIDVRVTFASQLKSLDWKWILGGLVFLLAIPTFWRWYGRRSQKTQRRPGSIRAREASGAGRRVREGANPIFISYRRSDSADITGRIYDRLVEEFGEDLIFKDVDSIPLGVDFKEYLDRKVGECRVVLAVIGDRWVDAADETGNRRLEDPDDFVRIELESALARGIPVIPLLVRNARMPQEEDLPPGLRKLVFRNGVPIRPDPDFHRDMDRLIMALEEYVG